MKCCFCKCEWEQKISWVELYVIKDIGKYCVLIGGLDIWGLSYMLCGFRIIIMFE